MKAKTTILTTTLIAGLLTVSAAFAQDYDLVINNGRVIDPETLFDDIANVGITDGRIVAISEDPLTGTETVDATGHIVAPGFIDTHFHFQMPIGYSLGLRDGLTSSMDFEMGCAGSYMAEWYEARAGVTGANYGCAVSHEAARAMFIDGSDGDYMKDGPLAAYETRKKTGWSVTRPTLEQGNAILEEIDKGLRLAPLASAAPWATCGLASLHARCSRCRRSGHGMAARPARIHAIRSAPTRPRLTARRNSSQTQYRSARLRSSCTTTTPAGE